MDSKRVDAEVDPGRADRVVRTRLDRELLLRLHALELVIGVVGVGRARRDGANRVGAARGRLLLAADRGRIYREDRAVSAKGPEFVGLLVDLELRGLLWLVLRHFSRMDVRDDDPGAGLLEIAAGIEGDQQILVH